MSELRDTLSAALDKAETGGADDVGTGEPVGAADQSGPVPPMGDATESAQVDAAGDSAAGRSDMGSGNLGRARDASGKFAKAEAKAEAKALEAQSAQAPVVAPVEPPKPAVEALKAPQSWKPAAREKWAGLAPEVQAEAVRLDRETQQTIRESAASRKLAGEFQQVVSPYLGMIQSEGSDPLKAVGNLLQTAAALRTAPPAHKAQLVAGIIQSYGISIDHLAAALNGQEAPQEQAQRIDPSSIVAQVRKELMGEMQQRQEHQTRAQSRAQTDAWIAKAQPEFLDDVREDMADIIEVASRRGVEISLEDAYNRAVKLHPEVSKVLEQREASKRATTAQAATQRALAASSSVKSQPASAPSNGAPRGLRAALEDAFTDHSGR